VPIDLIPSNLRRGGGDLTPMLEETLHDEKMSSGQGRLIHARSH
jgi:hypothetical protein